MNNIEIYVFEVVKYLPRHLREDVKLELTSQLMDMIEDLDHQDNAVQTVLESMGSPKVLADRYLNKQSALIGPRYYEVYSKIIKIVILALTLAFTITFGIKIFFSEVISLWIILEYFGTLLNASMMAFAYVTLIFAFMEYKEFKIEDQDLESTSWTINDLPQQIIDLPTHRFENIFEIGFLCIVLYVINVQPNLIGIYSVVVNANESVWKVIPILNEVTRSTWIILVNGWLGLLLLSGMIKAIYRLNDHQRMLTSTILDSIALGVFSFIVLTQEVIVSNVAGLIAPGNEVFSMMVTRGSLIVIAMIFAVNLYGIIKRFIKLSQKKV